MLHDPQTCQKYRLDYLFAESRRRALWLTAATSGKRQYLPSGEPKSGKGQTARFKSMQAKAPTRKTSGESRWRRKLMTVNAVQERQK